MFVDYMDVVSSVKRYKRLSSAAAVVCTHVAAKFHTAEIVLKAVERMIINIHVTTSLIKRNSPKV